MISRYSLPSRVGIQLRNTVQHIYEEYVFHSREDYSPGKSRLAMTTRQTILVFIEIEALSCLTS